MIKIIKEGIKKIAECKYCGCIFSYEDEDIRSERISQGTDGYTINGIVNRNYIEKCPQCTKIIILNEVKNEI